MIFSNTEIDVHLRKLDSEAETDLSSVDKYWKEMVSLRSAPGIPTNVGWGLAIGIICSTAVILFFATRKTSREQMSPSGQPASISVQDTLPKSKPVATQKSSDQKQAQSTTPAIKTKKRVAVHQSDGDSLHVLNTVPAPPTIAKKRVRVRATVPVSVRDTLRFLPIRKKQGADTLYFRAPSKKTDSSKIFLIEDTSVVGSLEELLLLPQLRNKVVYVDLWGTRCAPCIQEFAQIPALKQRYINKPVAFLYLKSPYGFDDSREWKEMVYRYNLEGVNVSMSIQFYSENFWKKYAAHYSEERMFAIPTYLIADKQGKIVDFDAARPGRKEALFASLDRLL
ncbi:MAG: hypothetical protein H7Y31_00690 [Chitinophagaceae bacterium]|nr:hypothetical protein [Chitinophagaceae bacterium]